MGSLSSICPSGVATPRFAPAWGIATLLAALTVVPGPAAGTGFMGVPMSPPWSAPDFNLVGASGAAFNFKSATSGKVTHVAFGYTTCTDYCPLLMERLVQASQELGTDSSGRVAFIWLTTDPKNDTPARLAEVAKSRGGGLTFVTGPERDVMAAISEYGTQPIGWAGGQQLHAQVSFLIDARGMVREAIHNLTWRPKDLVHDISMLLEEAAGPRNPLAEPAFILVIWILIIPGVVGIWLRRRSKSASEEPTSKGAGRKPAHGRRTGPGRKPRPEPRWAGGSK